MRPRDHHSYTEGRSGGSFDLFFYERVGERYYLRLTQLAAALVLGLTVLAVVGLCLLFLYNSTRPQPVPEVNIRVADPPANQAIPNTVNMPAKPVPNPTQVVKRVLGGPKAGALGDTPPPSQPGPRAEASPEKTPPER